LLCFLEQVVWIREEYNSVLPTPTEADKFGRFGRYRYIGKTQISADFIGPSLQTTTCFQNVNELAFVFEGQVTYETSESTTFGRTLSLQLIFESTPRDKPFSQTTGATQ